MPSTCSPPGTFSCTGACTGTRNERRRTQRRSRPIGFHRLVQNEFGSAVENLSHTAFAAHQRHRHQGAGLGLRHRLQQTSGDVWIVKIHRHTIETLLTQTLQRNLGFAEPLDCNSKTREHTAKHVCRVIVFRYQQCLKGHTACTLSD